MRILTGLLLVGVWLGIAATASAQYPSMMDRRPVRSDRRPAVSPYLDLLNPNRSFEESYFRRIRPELEFRHANDQLYRTTAAMEREIQALQSESDLGAGLGATGHNTSFMNYGGYYGLGGSSRGLGLGGGGGSGGLGGGNRLRNSAVLNGAAGSNLSQANSNVARGSVNSQRIGPNR